MAKWMNTDGRLVEVNDRPESIAAVKAAGWTLPEKKVAKKVAKKKAKK